jgi:hypothetical protein
MKTDYLNTAKRMATDSIYDDALFIGTWNGYEVYEPTFNDDEEHFVGFPEFIIAKAGSVRWSKDYKESNKIIRSLKSYHK